MLGSKKDLEVSVIAIFLERLAVFNPSGLVRDIQQVVLALVSRKTSQTQNVFVKDRLCTESAPITILKNVVKLICMTTSESEKTTVL